MVGCYDECVGGVGGGNDSDGVGCDDGAGDGTDDCVAYGDMSGWMGTASRPTLSTPPPLSSLQPQMDPPSPGCSPPGGGGGYLLVKGDPLRHDLLDGDLSGR